MNTLPRIRAARWAQRRSVAELVATALHPSSLGAWLVPDLDRRQTVLADVADIWVEHALFHGDVHVTDNLTAAAVGLHRLRPLPPPTNYQQRLTTAAGPYLERFTILDTVLETHRPTTGHHHLAFLATEPSAHDAEIDAMMLRHHLTHVDRINLPAWAEVTIRNRDLFTRHGYLPQAEITLPHGPTLLGMHRPASGTRPWPTNPTTSGTADAPRSPI
jgi:hypothetical protein